MEMYLWVLLQPLFMVIQKQVVFLNMMVLSTGIKWDFLPVLLQVVIAIGFAVAALATSVILGKTTRRNAVKDSPYECGMLPIGEAQPRFSVKFYLVAMIFLLFDIEVAFLYPWAMALRQLGWAGFVQVVLFMGLMLAGYVYVWRKGALDWDAEEVADEASTGSRKVA